MKWLLLIGFISVELSAQTVPEAYRPKCSPAVFKVVDRQEESVFTLVVSGDAAFRHWLEAEALPVTVTGGYGPAGIVTVRTTGQILLDKILPQASVLFVDRGPGRAREELAVPGHNLYVNAINAVHADFPDLDGRDRTVSIKEQRFDSADVDLRGRVADFDRAAPVSSSHAAVMATLIGGAGTTGRQGRGVALGCQLSSSDFASTLPDDPGYYLSRGIAVQNHSYGVGIENFYGAEALAFDRSVGEQPSLLHVFSAGNSGALASPSGPYAGVGGVANLTGNFKMAKNVLVVGSVDSFGRVPAYSSRGPAYDGRVKPDLVAFGRFGSSESAALVSGTALLLQQAYAEGQGGSFPPAALIRALLLNTADDAGLPGPDHSAGYGNLQSHRALRTLLDGRFALGQVAGGSAWSYDVDVPPGLARLQVMLAWDDLPGTPGAARALVNDLDLRLTGPDGQTHWLPWVAPSQPDSTALQAPAERRRDSLNTVEQVGLDLPAPGTYRLEVRAPPGLTGPQPFALTWRTDSLDAVRWTYPRRGDAVSGGQPLMVRWEPAPGLAGLSYRLEGQSDWTDVHPAVDLSWGHWTWPAPDTFAIAQLRLQAGGREWVSDSFLLSEELRLKVGFDCPDSLLLYWNEAGALASYRLWALQGRYLVPVLLEADTAVVLSRADFPETHFAVSPMAPGGLEGGRSNGIAPGLQGLDCYFQAFLAAFVPGEGVRLGVRLGTTAGLATVAVERWDGGGFLALQSWTTPPSPSIDFTDATVPPGLQRYRARLLRESGTVLFSDTLTVYVPGPEGYLIFPNPARSAAAVQVVTDAPGEVEFVLTDVLGRVVMDRLLEDIKTEMDLFGLPQGFYPWYLRREGQRRRGGVLVILP